MGHLVSSAAGNKVEQRALAPYASCPELVTAALLLPTEEFDHHDVETVFN